MYFYYVFTPDGISIEHNWNKVKSMIHRVPNSGCQRFDNKPNLERWLEYVEKYCNENYHFNIEHLAKIAHVLDVNIEDFFK